jgi:hypothetical protein
MDQISGQCKVQELLQMLPHDELAPVHHNPAFGVR